MNVLCSSEESVSGFNDSLGISQLNPAALPMNSHDYMHGVWGGLKPGDNRSYVLLTKAIFHGIQTKGGQVMVIYRNLLSFPSHSTPGVKPRVEISFGKHGRMQRALQWEF